MSDRDKKIILVLLILMVTILPYVFYIKDTKVKTETTRTEVTALQARYDQLQAMNEDRKFYEEEIVRLHGEMDKIIASFPAGIDSANYTMFLLQTEYSSDVIVDEETGEEVLQYPIIFDTVAFADNIETPISTEETDTGYVALTNVSELTYACYYDGMKYLLDYLMKYEDPMIYSAISMEFDDETGVITGSILLSQYAISGEDRELPDTDFRINVGDDKIVLDLDSLDLRGNEDVEGGIFGPVVSTGALEDEATAEEGTEGEEAEPEE